MATNAPPRTGDSPVDAAMLRTLLTLMLAGVIAWVVATHAASPSAAPAGDQTLGRAPIVQDGASMIEGPLVGGWPPAHR